MLGPACKPGGGTADSIPGDRSVIITLSSEKEPEPFFGVSSSSCNRDARSPEIFRRGEESELLEGSFAWPAIVADCELQLGRADQRQCSELSCRLNALRHCNLTFDVVSFPDHLASQSVVWERDYLHL